MRSGCVSRMSGHFVALVKRFYAFRRNFIVRDPLIGKRQFSLCSQKSGIEIERPLQTAGVENGHKPFIL